jgi:hypothetical protein
MTARAQLVQDFVPPVFEGIPEKNWMISTNLIAIVGFGQDAAFVRERGHLGWFGG